MLFALCARSLNSELLLFCTALVSQETTDLCSLSLLNSPVHLRICKSFPSHGSYDANNLFQFYFPRLVCMRV